MEIEGAIAEVVAATIEEAGARLRTALALGPEVSTIRLLLDPTSAQFAPWLEAAKAASREVRGQMVQGLFGRLFANAGYEVELGQELDVFARGRLRSLLVEVKSSLDGGSFGSQKGITQLEGYLVASERRRAQRWLGTMGINNPIELSASLRAYMRGGNVGLVEVRWVAPENTLPPYLWSVREGDATG
ncbi:MAG: hypothetical protein OK452_02025 [Thaumarchaeota archaeon]|nr:hypothetical protein [Nitrososphaerota archaeon]